MIMTTTGPASSPTTTIVHAMSPSQSAAASPDMLEKKHIIYRGLTKKSMEYMSLAHTNKHPDASHTLKGEILVSGLHRPGYIQYCITLDQEWMTRRVVLTAMFDHGNEKRLVLEVDHGQRWYRVTEHRLARSRSFFRGGINSPARSSTFATSSPRPANSTNGGDSSSGTDTMMDGRTSSESMQDCDSSFFSDGASCCSASSFSSSSSDLESATSSIPFERINLTWSPPPKGSSKRGSKRFSSVNPLRDVVSSRSSAAALAVSPTSHDFPSTTAIPNNSCVTTPLSSTAATACITQSFSADLPSDSSSTGIPATLMGTAAATLRSPVVDFTNRTLSKSSSSTSLTGLGGPPKSYEHLPQLDGCIHMDLGGDISPSTLLFPLRRATLGIDPENMKDHLESLIACPSAVTSEMSVVVSFPDLELRPVRTHVAYVGQGSRPTQSVVERWTDEDDDETESTLVEVDADGLVIQYGDDWARIPIC